MKCGTCRKEDDPLLRIRTVKIDHDAKTVGSGFPSGLLTFSTSRPHNLPWRAQLLSYNLINGARVSKLTLPDPSRRDQ